MYVRVSTEAADTGLVNAHTEEPVILSEEFSVTDKQDVNADLVVSHFICPVALYSLVQ